MYDDGRNMRAQRAGFKRHDPRDRNHSALRAQIDAVRSGLSVIASTGAETAPIRVGPFAELFERINDSISARRNQSTRRRRTRERRFRAGADGSTLIPQARRSEPTRLDGILSSVVRDIVTAIPDPKRREFARKRFSAALDPANAA